MLILMQSEHLFASHGWESERMSMSERIQQLEQEVGFLRMRQDDAAPDSDEEDSWADSVPTFDGIRSRCGCFRRLGVGLLAAVAWCCIIFWRLWTLGVMFGHLSLIFCTLYHSELLLL